MQGTNQRALLEFCEQAAVEQDPKKLLQLVTEINRLLEEKQHHFSSQDGSAKEVPAKQSAA